MPQWNPNGNNKKVEAWLIMRGTESNYSTVYGDGPYKNQKPIGKVTIVQMTVGKPSLKEDEIAFRLDIDIDADIFLDPTGTISVKIDNPAGTAGAANIAAQVDLPIRGRAKSAAAQSIGGTP